MSNPYNLKPGDTLIAARQSNGTLYAGKWVIRSVGRKWAVIDSPRKLRVDLETLEVEGGWSVTRDRCYLSCEHYEQDQRRRALWNQIREHVSKFNPPPGITIQRLEWSLGALRGGAE
jgi:hypothetical protein